MRSEDLFARIRKMQQRADGFIVLKGSMWTLAELTLVWNLSKISADHRKPIVLLGDGWTAVLQSWREHLAVTEEESNLLHIATKPDDAVNQLSWELLG